MWETRRLEQRERNWKRSTYLFFSSPPKQKNEKHDISFGSCSLVPPTSVSITTTEREQEAKARNFPFLELLLIFKKYILGSPPPPLVHISSLSGNFQTETFHPVYTSCFVYGTSVLFNTLLTEWKPNWAGVGGGAFAFVQVETWECSNPLQGMELKVGSHASGKPVPLTKRQRAHVWCKG